MPLSFVHALEAEAPLGRDLQRDLSALPGAIRRFDPGAEISEEMGAGQVCRLLVRGQAFKHSTLADGRRQIVMFLVPGDLCDLPRLWLPVDYGVTALGYCEVVTVGAARLRGLVDADPALAAALMRLSLREAAVQREWLFGMGRRTAYARVAHLLCEVVARMRAAGAATGRNCPFPASQQQIADATGLSVVHTNRVMQSLRRTGVVDLRSGRLTVFDWEGLVAAGEFDGGYLDIPPQAA